MARFSSLGRLSLRCCVKSNRLLHNQNALNNIAQGTLSTQTRSSAGLEVPLSMRASYSTTQNTDDKHTANPSAENNPESKKLKYDKPPQKPRPSITHKYEDVLKKLPIAFKNLNLELKSKQFNHAQTRLQQIRASLYENANPEENADRPSVYKDSSSSKKTSEKLEVENTGKKLDASIMAYQIALTAKQEDSQGNKRLYSDLMLERVENDSVNKVEQSRDHVDFVLQMISIFEDVEEYEFSIRLYKWLIQHHQKYNVVYYCRIGELYEKQKHYSMAIQYYTECLEVNKNFGQAYHRLSNIYEAQDQLRPALEYFAKYASIVFEKEDQVQEDEYIHVGSKLGHLLSVNAQYETADEYFQRLFSKYSQRVDVLYEWVMSMTRQRIDGRDTSSVLNMASSALENTVVSSANHSMEMYRALTQLHIQIERNLLELAQSNQDASGKLPIDMEEAWKYIEVAWKNATDLHNKQLVMWEAISLNPPMEYHDQILSFIASDPALYTNNVAFWNRVSRIMNPEMLELTEENKLQDKSYDIELYLVDQPVALVTLLAETREEAVRMALGFGKHVNKGANITNIQHPSLFYKPDSSLEYDWYGIKFVNEST